MCHATTGYAIRIAAHKIAMVRSKKRNRPGQVAPHSLATGNWQLATGNWQLATGNWQLFQFPLLNFFTSIPNRLIF